MAAARHHARDEAGSGKGGRGGKPSSASSATTKQTAAAKFLFNMIKCVGARPMHLLPCCLPRPSIYRSHTNTSHVPPAHSRTPTQEAAWPMVPQAEALAKLALVQMAEAGHIPNLQQRREQEAEALRILDAVLKVGVGWVDGWISSFGVIRWWVIDWDGP